MVTTPAPADATKARRDRLALEDLEERLAFTVCLRYLVRCMSTLTNTAGPLAPDFDGMLDRVTGRLLKARRDLQKERDHDD